MPLDLAINYNCRESEHYLTDVANTVEQYIRTQTELVATQEKKTVRIAQESREDPVVKEVKDAVYSSGMVASLRVDGHDQWRKTTLQHVKSLLASQDKDEDGTYPQLSIERGGWFPIIHSIMFGANLEIVKYLYEKTRSKELVKQWRGLHNRTLLYYAIYDVRNHHLIEWIAKTFPEYLLQPDEKIKLTPLEHFKSIKQEMGDNKKNFERIARVLGDVVDT